MIASAYWVPGNRPIVLDSRVPSALVISGTAVVFAVDKATGVRRPLFCVDPGEPLLPLASPPDAGWTIVAVPLESSGLQLGHETREWAGVVALENWLAKIGEAFGAVTGDSEMLALLPPQRLTLEKGQRATIEEGLTFVRIESGCAFAGARVEEGSIVALVPGLWLEALEDSDLLVLEDPPPDVPDIINATLERIVPAFIAALDEAERRREETDWERFANRQWWNARESASAVSALAGVATDAHRDSDSKISSRGRVNEDPLFVVVRMVADALGIVARRASSYRWGQDPVIEIAHASGLRSRRVVLRGSWWRGENGPLVAFQRDGSPVALLPAKTGFFGRARYEIFDPVEGTRRRVDPSNAAGIMPFARMLYRPLPDDLSTSGLIRHALAFRRRDLWIIAIAGAGAGMLALAAPQGVAILIGQAIPDADGGMVWQVTLGMVAAAFGSASLLLVQAVATLRSQTTGFIALQTGVWDYLLRLGPSFFRDFTAGQLRLRVDTVTRIHQMLTADALHSVFTAIASILTLALMFWYSPGLALIALLSGAVLIAGAGLGARALYPALERYQEMEERLFGLVLQAIQAVSKLRVAGAAGRAFSYWARAYSRKQKAGVSVRKIQDRVQVLNMVTPTIASSLGFLYLLSHPIPLGAFLASNAALTAFLTAIVSGSEKCASAVLTANMWHRMRSILAARPEGDASKTHPGRLRGAIAVEAVTFRYRADGPLILDSVSVKAEPGECIALTGPSGGGKSTLLNLILRFETPHSGAIHLDGRELSSLNIAAVRRQIGVVTQDARIMSGSIFENICCGGNRTLDEAWEAARAAGLAADIENMPMGMHTVISEGGGNISGGQRQRLLIARALVLKPSILIFDEATSALDNRTQAIVTASLRRLKATRILVAHRLSTIRNADRIYVIDKGRVVQRGTYRELVSQPGLFARLARRQTA
jgi:NHLM bacteriocin system ABC transporter ATP-binding protein